MKVWIDQDLCTGCGYCEETCPAVFVNKRSDGLSYVKAGNEVFDGHDAEHPAGPAGEATVPKDQESAVILAAEECPSEIIMIEVD